jgi:hypothetical protein
MRTYVGSVDPTTGRRSVVITDQDDHPGGGDLRRLLQELAEESTARYLGRPDPDPGRRTRVLEGLRAAVRKPEARPLPHRALHSPAGFGWGHTGQGPADLAYAILQRELVEEVPSEVYLVFCDQVISHLPVTGFHLPASDVWTWIKDNRTLIDEKVFGVEPDRPALAVVGDEDAPAASGDSPSPLGPTASALVHACEVAWGDIRVRHPELPEVVVVLGSGVERGRLVKLGHWWGGRWIADGEVRGEVLLAGEALHLEPKHVFEVLLHEAAHGLNAARGVKDTSRGGRYHNEKFATTAREVGLKVRAMPPYGMASTELTAETEASYEASITALGDAMRIARQLDGIKGVGAEGSNGKDTTAQPQRSRNAPGSECGCGRKMRMHESVLAQGPVICGVCGTDFTTDAGVRHEVELAQEPTNVDTSFQARRREALAAERQRQLGDLVEDTPRTAGHPAKRAGRSADDCLSAWYARYGTAQEAPIVAVDPADKDDLERTARALLRQDGTLRGPDVDLGPLDVAVGDRLVVQQQLDGGPPRGTLGSVVLVDAEHESCTVDFATWGTLQVDADSAEADALLYDYASIGDPHEVDVVRAPTVEREPVMSVELEP